MNDIDYSNYILVPDEAARLLRINKQVLLRKARQGKIPGAFKIGKLWRFRLNQLVIEG